ncbi:Oidioi.mRNA.OKI2018_I69.chr1.g1799.t1.cds [Oikopleura dioica]|uniref:Oidioi.mRNA.OKI2018_I69.chr1.g1799.t1.cds n=1 Tax=Oikopleura dioica TaxID=34765 RepID=A0ABN7ST87_OIKDI|nr:Oidioi.mRNA.OKI2018_I69.chr1.g1799.t1.cds [Oikopleura dioica]
MDEEIEKIRMQIENNITKIAVLKVNLCELKDPEKLMAAASDSLPTCSICLERYNKEDHLESVLTTCGHKFGRSCIEKSLETNEYCPKCNKISKNQNVLTIFE